MDKRWQVRCAHRIQPIATKSIAGMKTSFSLVKNVLVSIFLVTATVMVILAASVYFNVFHSQQDQQLAQRQRLVADRVVVDSNLIKLANNNIEGIIAAFNIHPDSESVAQPSQLQFHYLFADHDPYSDNMPPDYRYESIRRRLDDTEAAVQVINDSQSNTYLIVGQLDGIDGLVVNIMPVRDIHKMAFGVVSHLLLQSGLILLVTLLITYFVLRYQVQNPLEKIKLAVQALARGQYQQVTQRDIELPQAMGNEIDLLANAVLETAINVEETHTELEKKLEERTQALKNANKALYTVYSEQNNP